MNNMMLVILAAVLKLALLIQTFIQLTNVMALASQKKIKQSPNHPRYGRVSTIQKDSIDPQVTKEANITPIKQKTSASNIPPAVLAGLKYTDLFWAQNHPKIDVERITHIVAIIWADGLGFSLPLPKLPISEMKLERNGMKVNKLAKKYAMAHFSIFLCKVDSGGISSFSLLNAAIILLCVGSGEDGSESSESEPEPEELEVRDLVLLLLLLLLGTRLDLS
jgi:hypothetical protein